MSTIWDCPVTTPFGQVTGYPLNNGFHNGIDYGAPVGTDVTVNGVIIGKSGNTGYSTGPHCHVGHWRNGQVLDPGKLGGKTVSGATVSQVGQDATNGKYIRVQDADGSSWVYLHLSEQLATVGQVLNGKENDMPNDGDVDNVYLEFNGRKATADEKNVYTHKSWSATDGLYYGKVVPEVENLKKAAGAGYKPYAPPTLYVKG